MGNCWSSSDGREARGGDKEMRSTATQLVPAEANNNGVRILMSSSSSSASRQRAAKSNNNNSIAKQHHSFAHDRGSTREASRGFASAMQTSICTDRRSSAPTSNTPVLGESASVTGHHQARPTLLTRLIQATGSTRRRLHQSAKIDCDHQSEQQLRFERHQNQPTTTADPITRGAQQAASVGRKRKSRESPNRDKMHAGETETQLNNHEDPQQKTADDGQPGKPEGDESEQEIVLFTSIRQLCFEIISKQVLGRLSEGSERRAGSGRALCLFMFGRQGSCKGEIAFEIVGHSALLKALDERRPRTSIPDELECPLYHYLDVATMIVTNLDERVREYNQLVDRTTRNRLREQQLLALAKNGNNNSACSTDSDTDSDTTEQPSTRANKSTPHDSGSRERRSSDSTNSTSSSAVSTSSYSRASLEKDEQQADGCSWTMEDFGLITLSTKHRSILQLKLMKYYNSITSKWVFSLIQSEIERLESRVRHRFKPDADGEQRGGWRVPDRVYLVNLIPNQLSLFKSCLYLQQAPALSAFGYANYAIKFERRTNIRLMTKERLVSEQQARDKSADKGLSGNSLRLRLPTLLGASSPGSHADRAGQRGAGQLSGDGHQSIGEVAASLSGDKMGPKFNDTFAQHFARLNKLIQVRYNPTRDYNYAHEDDQEDDREEEEEQEGDEEASDRQEAPASSAELGTHSEPARKSGGREWARRRVRPASTCRRRLSCSHLPAESGARVCRPGAQLEPADRVLSASTQEVRASSPAGLRLRPPEQAQSGSLGSSLVSLLSAPQLQTGSERHHQQPTEGAGLHGHPRWTPLKWAVELQLFDSGEPAETASGSRGRQQVAPLALYSASGSSPTPSTVPSARDYSLIPVRVAYANEQSQLMLEAQRVHSRALKPKGRADIRNLAKLVRKATRQLQLDCSRWLLEAIERSTCADPEASGGRARGRQPAGQPALIVYSIPLDVARLSLGEQPASPTKSPPGRTTLEKQQQPSAKSLHLSERPSSAQPPRPQSALSRPASSRSMITSRAKPAAANQDPRAAGEPSARPPKRHVQFRLSPAPKAAVEELQQPADESQAPLRPQRRLWIRDTLFASGADQRALQLLPGLAELLNCSLTSS